MPFPCDHDYAVGRLVISDQEHGWSIGRNPNGDDSPLAIAIAPGVYNVTGRASAPDEPLKLSVLGEGVFVDTAGETRRAEIHKIDNLETRLILNAGFELRDGAIYANPDYTYSGITSNEPEFKPIEMPGIGRFYPLFNRGAPFISLRLVLDDPEHALRKGEAIIFRPQITSLHSDKAHFSWEVSHSALHHPDDREGLTAEHVRAAIGIIERWAEIDPGSFYRCARHALDERLSKVGEKREPIEAMIDTLDTAIFGCATSGEHIVTLKRRREELRKQAAEEIPKCNREVETLTRARASLAWWHLDDLLRRDLSTHSAAFVVDDVKWTADEPQFASSLSM